MSPSLDTLADLRPDAPQTIVPRWDAISLVPDAPAVARPAVSDGAVSTLVGHNLRRLRKQHRWSLDELALHSGVSRAMLGQIEQGKSVPSIRTLWQAAQALGVSVSWFLESQHDSTVLLIKPAEDAAVALEPGNAELRALHMPTEGHRDEFYELRLAPGSHLSLTTPAKPRRVNVALSEGLLEVVVGQALHRLNPREALQFEGTDALTWRNSGQVEAKAFVVIKPLPAPTNHTLVVRA
jgi:transcriptional regulator with XRE-family HTH domain